MKERKEQVSKRQVESGCGSIFVGWEEEEEWKGKGRKEEEWRGKGRRKRSGEGKEEGRGVEKERKKEDE
jgi:hypothetical protein